MNKFLKKALCLFTALTMTLSFSACEGLLEDLGNAITSGLESVLDGTSNSNPSTGGGQNTDSSSTGDSVSTGGTSTGGSSSTGGSGTIDPELPDDKTAKLDIHFLELGNKNSGDCTYIKAGDTDILIDAGSIESSASTIISYVDSYCTDGVFEYVIATHADKDHIAAFVGSNGKGIFDYYKIGTLIDFPRSDKDTQIYGKYKAKRDEIVAKGTKHYTALEWWKEEKGLTRSIEIADGITMNVLYQEFYENSHSDENNYSVCVLFSQGDNHYLFTGDLEKAGEESLVKEKENNLPKVKLYKGGHHGSATSSTSALLAKIQPEVVCVCCCAGDKYNFPTQDFINRVALYTDKIYVTTMITSTGFTSMNGNIVVSSTGGALTVNCSNNNTILKETAWFKANRTWPANGV